MNTFLEFRFICICEKLNKTFDEDAHAKVWNYFISNPEYTEVRDALKSGNKDRALELMRAELERASRDSDHPLNFAKADDSEFAMTGEGKNKRSNREDSDREQFDAEIEKATGGVTSLATQKKFKDAVEKGFPARKTGASKAELSKTWSSAGGTNTTPKADLEVYDPENEKNRRGISLKKAGGSQIASAEGGELKGTYKAATKNLVKKLTDFKSKEERKKIEREIMNAATRVADINDQARSANDDEKERLKNSGQEILDKIHDKYPNLTRLVTQVSTTGDEKFRGRNAPGSAGTIVTGDKAKPAEQQPSARPRNAKPKDKGRPGNVKIDNRPGKTKSNQAQPQQGPKTLKQFDREARTAELRSKGIGVERDERISTEREAVKQEKKERQAAERQTRYDARKAQQAQPQQGPITAAQFTRRARMSELQLKRAEKNLEVANIKAQNASVPIDPDTGEPIPARFRATAIQNMAADPTSRTAKINNARREKSQSIITKAQSEYDNAAASHQETQSTLDAIQQNKQPQQQTPPSEQQPQQSAAPTTPSEPTQPQQQTQPPQQTPAQEQQPQQQPEPSGPKTAAQQAAELGLTGDGHGRWYDNKGNVAAETEGDILKRTAPLKPKPKNTGTAERMDAAGKKLGLPDS
jgi:hypothetical protein